MPNIVDVFLRGVGVEMERQQACIAIQHNATCGYLYAETSRLYSPVSAVGAGTTSQTCSAWRERPKRSESKKHADMETPGEFEFEEVRLAAKAAVGRKQDVLVVGGQFDFPRREPGALMLVHDACPVVTGRWFGDGVVFAHVDRHVFWEDAPLERS